ncbi:MAG: TonB-dependent receptor [Parvularculaceae bacterium]
MGIASKYVRDLLQASAMAAVLLPALAFAQSGSDGAAGARATDDQIVVTARRRDESIQDVPAQVTVLNSSAIENRNIQKPADFVAQVPNVTFVETQNAGTSFLVIRGISQARNSEPSASIVVDGVPMTQPAQFNQELIDIEQIEVLKGPQGALYGRNAIGGAIVITTKKPSDEFEAKLLAGYESGPGYRLQGTVNIPLAENFYMRGAISYFDTDGHLTNVNTADATAKKNVDPVEDLNARVSFLYEPTDNFSVDLRLSADLLDTRALYYVIPDFSDPNFNNPNNTSRPINLNNSGVNERDIYDAALKLTYGTDYGEFTSITGYNSVEELLTGDGYPFDPFGPFPINRIDFNFNQSQFLDVETFTQELRFTSPSDKRFRYIIGGQIFVTDRFISTGNMFDTGAGVFPIFHEPSTNPDNPQVSFLADSQDQFAWAVYLDTSFNITDDLELSLNVRYDRDKRENTTETPTAFLPCAPSPICGTGVVRENTWDDWQPQAILRYTPTDALTLFASYGRGFRSGGFNQTGVGTVAAAGGFFGVGDLFDQETADTFEGGFKTSFLDGRANLNASAYFTKAEGTYYFIFIAANSTQNLGNIDEVEYKGFDVELNVRPTDQFSFNAGFGFTDSEITEFPDAVAIGAEAPLVAKTTANIGAEYRTPIMNGVDGLIRVDYNRIGHTTFTIPFSAPSLGLDAFPVARNPVDLVNLRAGIEGEAWSLMFWSRNLLDEEYNTEYSPGGFLFKAQPRRWGVDLTLRF